MLIKELVVKKTKPCIEVIRKISFNLSGLNLIVDNTENIEGKTGNSVGKTTVVKIIDLCLNGNNMSSLYKDKDTKSENIDIKELLEKSKVEAELVLTDGVQEHRVVRPLYNRGKKKIDGKVLNNDEFKIELKKILFDSEEEKPTLRQLIPRFVRIEDKQLDNIINYLPMTSKETYEAINLFLLRSEDDKLLSQKNILEEKIRTENNKLDYYKKDKNILSLDFLNQRKKIIQSDLDTLYSKRKEIDYVDIYEREINNKSKINEKINKVNSEIELLEFEKSMIEKSIKDLKKDKFNVDLGLIEEIYIRAKSFNKDLQKEFQDIVNFHNSMIDNRIEFIMPKLNVKEELISKKYNERELLIKEKKDIIIDLVDQGLLNELENINEDIDNLNIEKGEVLKAITILEDINGEIDDLNEQLNSLNEKMNLSSIDEKISKFNEYFSEYSEKLYGEKFIYVYNKRWKERKDENPFTVGNVMGGMGAGKKRGLIIAFDLAYLKFVNYYNIVSPQFIIHDKLENTHINQLRSIFDLCSDINGQYIVPILRERIDALDSDIIEKAKIIELKESDRFFRV